MTDTTDTAKKPAKTTEAKPPEPQDEEAKLLEEHRKWQEQHAERRAEREKRERIRELKEKMEREQREELEAAELEAAEEKHGAKRVALVPTDLGAVIVKAAHEAHVRKWQDKGGSSTEDFDRLIHPCLLYPSRGDYVRMLSEQPLLRIPVAKAILKLAGAKLDEQAGKS